MGAQSGAAVAGRGLRISDGGLSRWRRYAGGAASAGTAAICVHRDEIWALRPDLTRWAQPGLVLRGLWLPSGHQRPAALRWTTSFLFGHSGKEMTSGVGASRSR